MGSIEKTWQSAKNERLSVAVRKELLSLRHRFGEKTSCKGQLTTSFQLVNSGKIISKDGRQVSTPYYYRAWTAFLHFLIRFTRADQRNERSWDTLFSCVLAWVKCKLNDKCVKRRKNIDETSISLQNVYICRWNPREKSRFQQGRHSESLPVKIAKKNTGDEGLMLTFVLRSMG